jgi:outer membrane receptor protein involved in Fe transport
MRAAQHKLNLRLQVEVAGLTWTAGVNNVLNYNYNYTQLERNLGEIRNFIIGVNGAFYESDRALAMRQLPSLSQAA